MLMLMIMMVFQKETHLINIASQEIKYFNVLIKNKSFFEQLNKKKISVWITCWKTMTFQEETYCLYHQKYYKLICIGISRQTNWTIQQKVNFMGK